MSYQLPAASFQIDPLRRPGGRHLPLRGRKNGAPPCVVADAPPRPPVLRPRGQDDDSLRSCAQYSVLSSPEGIRFGTDYGLRTTDYSRRLS